MLQTDWTEPTGAEAAGREAAGDRFRVESCDVGLSVSTPPTPWAAAVGARALAPLCECPSAPGAALRRLVATRLWGNLPRAQAGDAHAPHGEVPVRGARLTRCGGQESVTLPLALLPEGVGPGSVVRIIASPQDRPGHRGEPPSPFGSREADVDAVCEGLCGADGACAGDSSSAAALIRHLRGGFLPSAQRLEARVLCRVSAPPLAPAVVWAGAGAEWDWTDPYEALQRAGLSRLPRRYEWSLGFHDDDALPHLLQRPAAELHTGDVVCDRGHLLLCPVAGPLCPVAVALSLPAAALDDAARAPGTLLHLTIVCEAERGTEIL